MISYPIGLKISLYPKYIYALFFETRPYNNLAFPSSKLWIDFWGNYGFIKIFAFALCPVFSFKILIMLYIRLIR